MGRRGKGRRNADRRDRSAAQGAPSPGGLLGAIPRATLDLHGETASAAEGRATRFLTTQARIHRGEVVHVITGSGLGSPGPPVLRTLVGELLEGPLARYVDDHRMDLHRGGWLVRLR